MRRSAVIARSRVRSALFRAALMMWRELSARIGVRLLACVKFGDHLVEVGEDLAVHLGDAGLPVAGGGFDERQRAVPLLAQFGQELWAGDEDRAGQAPLACGQVF